MNKLKTLLCAVFTLMLVNVSTAQSDSGNFAGPYVGLQLLGLGAEFDGKSNSSVGTSAPGTITDNSPLNGRHSFADPAHIFISRLLGMYMCQSSPDHILSAMSPPPTACWA